MHPRGWAGRGTGEGGEPRARRGACLLCRLPTLPLLSFLPPIPLPPSPVGKGEILGYFMQGASPLASPGLGEQVPPGCLPSLPPAHPAFALLSCPYPPVPLPGGKGETKVILCKGLRPLHPRGWVGRGTGEGGDFLFVSPGATAPGTPAAEPIRRGFDLGETVSFGYAKDLSLQ